MFRYKFVKDSYLLCVYVLPNDRDYGVPYAYSCVCGDDDDDD